MTHQDVGAAEVLPDLLDQIPADTLIGVVAGDGAYDTRSCHAVIAARGTTPSIPPRDGAAPWSKRALGAAWRNGAIDVIVQSSQRAWTKGCGYHRRSLDETLMYRLKVLPGRALAARTIGAQATEVAIHAGVRNRMTSPARPKSVRIARIHGESGNSRLESIYATYMDALSLQSIKSMIVNR